MSESVEGELKRFLLDAFTNQELHAFLVADTDTRDVARVVPDPSVPPEVYATEVVAALGRRGLLRRPLFTRLKAAREHLAADVARVSGHALERAPSGYPIHLRCDRVDAWTSLRDALGAWRRLVVPGREIDGYAFLRRRVASYAHELDAEVVEVRGAPANVAAWKELLWSRLSPRDPAVPDDAGFARKLLDRAPVVLLHDEVVLGRHDLDAWADYHAWLTTLPLPQGARVLDVTGVVWPARHWLAALFRGSDLDYPSDVLERLNRGRDTAVARVLGPVDRAELDRFVEGDLAHRDDWASTVRARGPGLLERPAELFRFLATTLAERTDP